MRGQIIDSIFQRMTDNQDIFFLTADMGINLVEKFEEHYPARFANVGIAEQNLIGISAGLANLGYRPFAYTISNFAIHRCFEQIRNEIGIHDYPVTLLGTSTGYDNAPLGPTHHVIDDWGALKSIPGIDIYCPSSTAYAATLVGRILEAGRPAYVRIPKGGYTVPDSDEHMVKLPGETNTVLLVSYGTPAQACIEVRTRDPRISVLVINRLRPLDESALAAALEPHERIYVVEDHFPESGLYGAVCEFIARHPVRGRVESVAPRDYTLEVGTSPRYFHRKYGLDAASLLESIRQNL
jgi:transketolase